MTSRTLACALVAAVVSSACSDHIEGIGVELEVTHQAGDDPELAAIQYGDGETRGFVTDRDYGVVLYRTLVVLGSASLLRCKDDGLGAKLEALFRPVSKAYAHATLGITPHVIDLSDADRVTRLFTRVEPAPGSYCGLRVELSPAEENAEGLPDDLDMLGSALYVEGGFVAPDESVMRPLLLRDDAGAVADLDLVDAHGTPTPLELSADTPKATVQIDFGYYRLLDGIDLASTPDEIRAPMALQNLLEAARAVAANE